MTIDGFLAIRANSALSSLMGLENVDTTTLDRIYITGNTSLSECAIESICAYLAIEGNPATIAKNVTKCANRVQVDNNYTAASNLVVAYDNRAQNNSLSSTAAPRSTAADQIKLYPNPTTGLLQICQVEAQRVVVFNSQGQQLAQYDAPGSELDLQMLPAGLYYLRFFTTTAQYTRRVVKVD